MFENTQPYFITNEFNVMELMAHFDSDYIFDIMNEKINNLDFTATLPQPNIIQAYEDNFKAMEEAYPGDSTNIRNIREETYRLIIKILTEKFNLEFNMVDDNIDLTKAAYYLYEFLISKRNEIMTNFFVAFIWNNRDSLHSALTADGVKRARDASSNYAKMMYDDNKFALITSQLSKVIGYISEMDVKLVNIFQSTYMDYNLVMFLDNAFADKGNFFKQYYCGVFHNPEIAPVVLSNIKLALSTVTGNSGSMDMARLLQIQGGN